MAASKMCTWEGYSPTSPIVHSIEINANRELSLGIIHIFGSDCKALGHFYTKVDAKYEINIYTFSQMMTGQLNMLIMRSCDEHDEEYCFLK